MKLKSLILTMLFVATSPALASSLSCNSAPLNLNTIIQMEGPQTAHIQASDIMLRCSTLISDLQAALSRANVMARAGKMSKAAEYLYSVLINKSQTLPAVGYPEAPHTVQAIFSSVEIARSLITSTQDELPSLGNSLVGQVRFTGMVKLYKVVQHAYQQLDERYYLQLSSPCSRRVSCRENPVDTLPSEYFNGVVELANMFIRMQVTMGPIEASDRVELQMSESVARAAKNILLNSVFRRGLACQITSLHALEMRIHRHLNCGDEYPSFWLVPEVRETLRSLQLDVPRC